MPLRCRRRWVVVALTVMLTALLPPACASGGGNPEEPLLVAAAASLEAAFTAVGDAYSAQTGRPVAFVFGSSGNLSTQIENGAPFDVFASADEGFVKRLSERDLVLPDTQAVYAQGGLVLAVNAESGLDVTEIGDLADSRVMRVAIANPALAPYGLAAQQALQAAGVWDAVEPKIVFGANVRQALQYVQTGDAAAGLVARSIADVPEVTYVPVDQALYEPLYQKLAVVAATKQEQAARDFVAFVLGDEGRAILVQHGFTQPGAP